MYSIEGAIGDILQKVVLKNTSYWLRTCQKCDYFYYKTLVVFGFLVKIDFCTQGCRYVTSEGNTQGYECLSKL